MRRKKSKKGLIGGIALLVGAAIVAGFVYTSPKFERIPPEVKMPAQLYWNTKTPLRIAFADDTSLKSYKVVVESDGTRKVAGEGRFGDGLKEGILKLPYSSSLFSSKAEDVTLEVSVKDGSLWNFFQGNETVERIKVHIDRKRPNVNILANSRMIAQGGSALVVFLAEDANLETVYVEANGNRFKPQPYKKEGYYATLVAWPFTDESFDAKIVAKDKAGNVKTVHIPFYHANPKYRTSYIRARDSFIEGKITDLASSDPDYASIEDKLDKLRAVNEKMRLKNEALIHRLSKGVSNEMLQSWHIERFYPLKNGKRVASFGDHRYYYYGEKSNIVSESYHVGYDLASVKMADIVASNPGRVVYADENGIYGNMPLIDHGLGLYTLYGHCSKLMVQKGDDVKRGQVIAKTGMTGLALGDHLHFGMLVQGVEVRPVEWFDAKWIRKFIDNVFKEADAVIDGKTK